MGKNFSKQWVKAAEQNKITAIAVPFENESHVITPRSWMQKQVWVMTQEEYERLKGSQN